MRYELTDFEWSAIKPFLWVSGRFWRRVIRQAYNVNVTGSNPVPATTFVITHSPSRSNRRDGGKCFLQYAGSRCCPDERKYEYTFDSRTRLS